MILANKHTPSSLTDPIELHCSAVLDCTYSRKAKHSMKAFQGLSSVAVPVSTTSHTLEEKSDCAYTTHYLAGTETLKYLYIHLSRKINYLKLFKIRFNWGHTLQAPLGMQSKPINIRQCPDKCL